MEYVEKLSSILMGNQQLSKEYMKKTLKVQRLSQKGVEYKCLILEAENFLGYWFKKMI